MIGVQGRQNHKRDRSGLRSYQASPLPTWVVDWGWLLIVGWIAVSYFLINYRWPAILSGSLSIYLAQPLTWGSLGLMSFMAWRFGVRERPKITRRLLGASLLVGLFQVAVYALAGLFASFGHSPYGRTLPIVLGNLFYIGTMIVGVELARAYLVMTFSRGSRLLALVLPSLLFAFVGLPVARLSSIDDMPTLFRVTGETVLPSISMNFLASSLAILGGPLAAIAYRTILELFEWLSPILPRLHWTVTAFLGTMAPVLGMLLVRSLVQEEWGRADNRGKVANGSSSTWILIGLLGVAVLWFNTGLLGVRPTLISGVSMEPALLAGDIVITRDVPSEQIEIGDIVRFRVGNSYVIHRVIDIDIGESQTYFITQGDANNVQDAPMLGSQLEGKVILAVPKIGWLAIGVRRLIELIL